MNVNEALQTVHTLLTVRSEEHSPRSVMEDAAIVLAEEVARLNDTSASQPESLTIYRHESVSTMVTVVAPDTKTAEILIRHWLDKKGFEDEPMCIDRTPLKSPMIVCSAVMGG